MKYRSIVAISALALLCSAGFSAAGFRKQISKEEKILHALNRLTFGPRTGDFERVKSIGLKRWIDQQLHPERIPENPVLEAKLKPLDTLGMSATEMVLNYPPPQLIRQMVAGRIPFPSDPEKQATIRRLAARYERKSAPDPAQILTPEQRRGLRTGTPQERLAMFQSLPPEKQDEVLDALPAGVRMQVFAIAPPDLRRRIAVHNAPQQVVVQDLTDAKLYRAIYSNRQLAEVLTDFWFNHFNVFLDKGADRYLVTSYERDVIRPHVLGKFEDLLRATAESPAMLFYLDNWQSVAPDAEMYGRRRSPAPQRARRGLNENYGRELLELHSLGVDGGYTQKDVTEVARCFTGWTIRDPQRGGGFEFNPRMHDKGEKVVLGVRIPAGGGQEDGLKVLDIVAHHPSTARFISRKLAQRFVADNPPPSLIERMAKTFTGSNGDIREVLKTMLKTREFWSQDAYRSKVKSPLEMVASAARAMDADIDFGFALAAQVAQLGQPLYRKQEPTGYSNTNDEWVNTAGLVGRMNFAQAFARNRIPGVKADPARLAADPIGPTLPADLPAPERAALALGSPAFQRR